MSERHFSLNQDQIPDYPTDKAWTSILRWLVCVMDHHDTRLGFISGCLSYAIKNEGLTPKQAEACNHILEAIRSDFMAGILVCQNTAAPSPINTEKQGRPH